MERCSREEKKIKMEKLYYEGLWQDGAVCGVDFITQLSSTPIIMLTELEENQNTSITNRAERVYYLAWEKFGKPYPCRFIERYPPRRNRLSELDSFSEVFFDGFKTKPFRFKDKQGMQFELVKWESLVQVPFSILELIAPNPFGTS